MSIRKTLLGILAVVMSFGLFFGSADSASASPVSSGSICLGTNVALEKGGNYIGMWVIGDFAGEGQPETKVCERQPVTAQTIADFSENKPCYVKWAAGPSFIGRLFFDQNIRVYGCRSL